MDNAEKIYHDWDKALSENNVEALLALYADDVIVESPLIPYLLQQEEGVCRGKEELRALVEMVAKRKPNIRKFYRSTLLCHGNLIMWEYPRDTPQGEQMDFAEIMNINDSGLIQSHRVYWGWKGFQVINKDLYHRE